MKKNYQSPEWKKISFRGEDVLLFSGLLGGGGEGSGGGDVTTPQPISDSLESKLRGNQDWGSVGSIR